MREVFTRECDDPFSPASRGTEMSVSVCVGLWQKVFHYVINNLKILI